MIIKQKVNVISAISILIAVLGSYYAFEHIGVYLVEKTHSLLWSIISVITSIILIPGFYLFLLLGGSAHAGINTTYEKITLMFGSWFVWTTFLICATYLVRIIRKKFFK